MHRWTVMVFASCVGLGTIAPAKASSRDAKEILNRVDDLYRGNSSHGTMSMTVTTEHWSRTLKIEFWSEGTERSLMRILSPKKERGTTTLRAGDNIWNYLPKVKRTIKVPSSMMGGAWMGSHFTNDDLVKQSRMAEDYAFQVTFTGTREGVDIIEVTCIPKPGAAVVWGKVVVIVRQESIMPVRIDYYDEDLALARDLSFSDIQTLGGRKMPTVMRMQPTDKPGAFTEVRYHDMAFDVSLRNGFFSLRNLRR